MNLLLPFLVKKTDALPTSVFSEWIPQPIRSPQVDFGPKVLTNRVSIVEPGDNNGTEYQNHESLSVPVFSSGDLLVKREHDSHLST